MSMPHPSVPANAPWDRRVQDVIRGLMQGRANDHGRATLPDTATQVQVTDARCGVGSVILLQPENTAAAALAHFVDRQTKGSFYINATGGPTGDAVFGYTIRA